MTIVCRDDHQHIVDSGLSAADIGNLQRCWYVASDQEIICTRCLFMSALIPLPHRVAGHKFFNFVTELYPH
jgi:hypothetical protein